MDGNKILVVSKYLELGLAVWPLTNESSSSIDAQLATLTPEEARKCKRKFRKEWRKRRRNFSDKEMADCFFGTPGKGPSASQKQTRKSEVHVQIFLEATQEKP